MNRDIKQVNILGTNYEVHYEKETGRTHELDVDGACEPWNKSLHINDFEPEIDTVRNMESYKNKVLRHEIVHAFMYESGLSVYCDWSKNEQLIDFLAHQIPKMYKAMKDLEVID